MKTLLLPLIFVAVCTSAFSQKEVDVNGDEDVNEAFANVKLKYPQFTSGVVHFKDATFSRASLNYNYLSGEMLFKNLNGDTLALTDEATIKDIIINSDTFYYDKMYLQFIAGNASVRLAKKETYYISDVKKVGAHGILTSTDNVGSVVYVNNHGKYEKLPSTDTKLIYMRKSNYYIGDSYNHFLPAAKKNVYKLFGKNENDLNSYFDNNAIIFSKEDDLKKLIAFLQTLQQ